MKSLADLKHYYRHDLSGSLQELEHRRRSLLIQLVLLLGVALTVGINSSVVPFLRSTNLWILVLVAVLIIYIVFAALRVKRFKLAFKREIVGRMVQFMDSGLTYDPKGAIIQNVFEHSGLYSHRRFNRYHGEDLISGRLNDCEVDFCELTVQHRSGGKNSSTTTIFHGLFLVADADREFDGGTMLLPTRESIELPEGMLGNLVKGLIERFVPEPVGEKVAIDDPEFSALFDVHATQPEAARALLTPALRERILALRPSSQSPLAIAFKDGHVYAALDSQSNMFEPKLFKTVRNYELVQDFFRDFSRACDLVESVRAVPATQQVAS